jgi:hypothetical protein
MFNGQILSISSFYLNEKRKHMYICTVKSNIFDFNSNNKILKGHLLFGRHSSRFCKSAMNKIDKLLYSHGAYLLVRSDRPQTNNRYVYNISEVNKYYEEK